MANVALTAPVRCELSSAEGGRRPIATDGGVMADANIERSQSSQSMRPAGAPWRCESISASSRCADVGALGTEAPASALTAIVSTIDVAASRLERPRGRGGPFPG